MSSNLVTVATFTNPLEANLAKNRLAEMGVPSFLVGEEAVSMAWLLTNAVGGIQLQVNEADADKALAIFETDDDQKTVEIDAAGQPADAIQPPGSIQTEVVDEEEDEEPPRTSRELNADRACMASLLSLIIIWLPQTFGLMAFFLIWQVYVFALLLQIYGSGEDLRPRYLVRAILAAVVSSPFVAALSLKLLSLIIG